MSDPTLTGVQEFIEWTAPPFKTVSPRTIRLRADLHTVVTHIAERHATLNRAVVSLYDATPTYAVWQIGITRQGVQARSPNCLLVAEQVGSTETRFTLVPFRHTFPDQPSQIVWGWCSNLFLSRRWIHYSQLQPFLLNETGKYQYTSDEELALFIARAAPDEAAFKERLRRNYAALDMGNALEQQVNLEWERLRRQHQLAVERARAELAIRGAGEELGFEQAAQAIVAQLGRSSG